jgi:predicted lysophospholipase L1 biosynthesis ABC-type transport system permease subunit
MPSIEAGAAGVRRAPDACTSSARRKIPETYIELIDSILPRSVDNRRLVVVSGAIAIIAGLGLMTTMSLNVNERRREIGILRAIGASPRVIAMIIVGEGVVIATVSWLLGTAVSWPVSLSVAEISL